MPLKSFASDGTSPTGRLRVRPIFFGLFCVVEELIEHHSGSFQWERIWYPHEITKLLNPSPTKEGVEA